MRSLKALALAMAFSALAMVGCGSREADFVTYLTDAKGLTDGSKIMWQGLEVGEVQSPVPDAGKVKVVGLLKKESQNQLRKGVTARAVPSKGEIVPFLELIGGTDVKQPLLAKGAVIPETGLLNDPKAAPIMIIVASIIGIAVVVMIIVALAKRKKA